MLSNLLITLLDYTKPFTLKDLLNEMPFRILYQKVSERTARRDLKKLSGLLWVNDDNKYELNWKILEG